MPRLLLRDAVTLRIGGGYDENMDPLPVQNLAIRAEMVPVSGDQQSARGRSMSLTTYRLVVSDPRIEQVTKVSWRGKDWTLEGRCRTGSAEKHITTRSSYPWALGEILDATTEYTTENMPLSTLAKALDHPVRGLSHRPDWHVSGTQAHAAGCRNTA